MIRTFLFHFQVFPESGLKIAAKLVGHKSLWYYEIDIDSALEKQLVKKKRER